MIDCHAHAFPDATYLTSRLLESVSSNAAQQFQQSLAPYLAPQTEGLSALCSFLTRPPKSGKSLLDIEGLARLRAHLPEAANKWLEIPMSIVGMPLTLLSGTIEQLLSSMRRTRLDQSVLIAAPPLASNAWVLGEALAKDPEALIPVCALPTLSASAAEQEWADGFTELAQLGTRGFKIHPNIDGLDASHPAYRAMFQVAESQGLFVILHTGRFTTAVNKHNRPADPYEYKPLFRDYPRVKVCLAHMNRDDPELAWELLKQYDQLFTDTSWQPAHVIVRALKTIGSDRVLLGSDWPLLHPDLQKNALDILSRATSEKEFESVTKRNPRRFLER